MAYSPTSPHWERTPGYGIPKWLFWRKPLLILGKQLAIKPSHVSFLWNYRNQPWQRKIRHRWFPQLTKSLCRGFSFFFYRSATLTSIRQIYRRSMASNAASRKCRLRQAGLSMWIPGQATLVLPNDFKHIWRFGGLFFLHSPKGAEVHVSHISIYIILYIYIYNII